MAIVRWSDGDESEALRWYDDEVLFTEGDLLASPPRSSAPSTSCEIATTSVAMSATAVLDPSRD